MKFEIPENAMLEYKQGWTDTAKKTMIAFANDAGGTLLFGIKDDGEVIGCDFDEIDRQVMSFARNGVEPSMSELVKTHKHLYDGKAVAQIVIESGTSRPYSFRGKTFVNGGVYIRLGGQTVAANIDEVIKIIQRGDPRSWESRPCNFDDLTFESTEAIFSDNNILFSKSTWLGLGLVDSFQRFTNLALLLSDQCPYRIVINNYADDGSVVKTERIQGSILQQMNVVQDKLSLINVPFINKETGQQARSEQTPWPKLSVRESLTNALAHRDYSSPMQTSINIHPNVISFVTPGGIPPELTLEEALIEGASFCRNEKLSELFVRLRWMEKAGTGFGDIVRGYAKYAEKPIFRHVGRTFLIELPNVTLEGSDRKSRIVRYVRESVDGRTRQEIETFFKVSRPTIMKDLNALIMEGKLMIQGNGPSRRYYSN